MNPRLVVFLQGGLVLDIYSSIPVEVLIIDCDTEGSDDLKTIKDWDFKKAGPSDETLEAFGTAPWEPFVDPAAVEHFFTEMEKGSEVTEDAKEVVSEVQEGGR